MKIGIDAMGGDFAPEECVKGAIQSLSELNAETELVLFGDEKKLRELIADSGGPPAAFTLVHCPEVIGMAESPTRALSQKTRSSIAVGFHFLKEKKIDAFAGAGNTGAMLVGAMYSVKTVEGVLRPAISTIIPHEDGHIGLLLDIGANADCKPEFLAQFAVMGSLYLEHVYNIENPRVALLSIGEEEGKGNLVTQAAYPLLQQNRNINFVGNIEGRDIFGSKAEIIVADGFTGNIVLKFGESIYEMIKRHGIKDEFWDRFNYENYGGTGILGANAPVVIGHGISNAAAFKSMILLTRKMIESKIVEKMKHAFLNHQSESL